MNKREQFKQVLRGKTEAELLAMLQETQTDYENAQTGGHMSLVAVLYFDKQAIIAEMDERKSS